MAVSAIHQARFVAERLSETLDRIPGRRGIPPQNSVSDPPLGRWDWNSYRYRCARPLGNPDAGPQAPAGSQGG
jgi:hypothetical protein